MSGITITLDGLEETLRLIVRDEIAEHTAQDEWLDSRAAAAYLVVSLGHLHNMRGVIPSHKLGGRLRFRRSDLDTFVEGRTA